MFKKLILLLALTAFPVFGQLTGSGTEGDPYLIYTAAGLDSIHDYVSTTSHFKLMADIDASSLSWVPVSVSLVESTQVDGNGYTVSNLDVTWNDTYPSGGFFGDLTSYDDAGSSPIQITILKDITFDSMTVHWDSTGSNTNNYAGFITGTTTGGGYYHTGFTVENVVIKNSTIWRTSAVGGVYTQIGAMVGQVSTTDDAVFFAYRVKVDSCLIYTNSTAYNARADYISFGVGRSNGGAVHFEQVAIKNSDLYENNSGGEYTTGLWTGGFIAYTNSNDIDFQDCYYKDNFIKGEGKGGGTSDKPFAAHLIGATSGCPVTNVYIAADSGARYNAAIEGADYYGWVSGATGTGGSQTAWVITNSYVDTTNLYVSGWYGTYGAGNTPNDTLEHKTQAELKVKGNFTSWDFTSVWGISSVINDGMPHLRWEYGGITILTPDNSDAFYPGDTINVTYDGTEDTVLLYYTLDNKATWNFIDTATGGSYEWLDWIASLASVNSSYIRATSKDSLVVDDSQEFSVFASAAVDIIYPTDSSGTVAVGDVIPIMVQTTLCDSVSLWYSVNDTVSWVPIVYNLTDDLVSAIDTITYNWTFPNINGDIYIKANQVADTAIYALERSATSIGSMERNYPTYCWGFSGGTPVAGYWIVDISCGWGVSDHEYVTNYLDDDGMGFTYLSNSCPHPYTGCSWNVPAGVWLYDAVDTTYYTLNQFYADTSSSTDTLTYQGRKYYILNEKLYATDLVNDIDSILICDMSDYYSHYVGGWYIGWIEDPAMQLYNVQRSKIQGDTLSVDTNFESLNDASFTPLLLLYADNTTRRGGTYALELPVGYPPTANPAYDIQRIFLGSGLTVTRDYFRGIDPKAHKIIR